MDCVGWVFAKRMHASIVGDWREDGETVPNVIECQRNSPWVPEKTLYWEPPPLVV